MTIQPITPDATPDATALKRNGAAKDFEALLIAQLLHTVRGEGSGWLGSGEDQSSDAAFGLGEEELARSIASSGGFGLGKLIEQGLSSGAYGPAKHDASHNGIVGLRAEPDSAPVD
jgi:Rod binding domain-containing protein